MNRACPSHLLEQPPSESYGRFSCGDGVRDEANTVAKQKKASGEMSILVDDLVESAANYNIISREEQNKGPKVFIPSNAPKLFAYTTPEAQIAEYRCEKRRRAHSDSRWIQKHLKSILKDAVRSSRLYSPLS